MDEFSEATKNINEWKSLQVPPIYNAYKCV
ncbi:hypothetical protein Q604_UNBC10090G0001, partial [human gut metagenome]